MQGIRQNSEESEQHCVRVEKITVTGIYIITKLILGSFHFWLCYFRSHKIYRIYISVSLKDREFSFEHFGLSSAFLAVSGGYKPFMSQEEFFRMFFK